MITFKIFMLHRPCCRVIKILAGYNETEQVQYFISDIYKMSSYILSTQIHRRLSIEKY